MSTGRDLIKQSLKIIGALAAGETPSADDQSDALITLNRMLDSWSNEDLVINAKTSETFSLTPSQQTYTMGPTGTWVTTRPITVLAINLLTNSIELPLEMLTVQEWEEVRIKSLSSTLATKVYLSGTNPNETFNFWPIPQSAQQVVIYSLKPLTNIQLSVDAGLPPGYEEAIVYNLAVRLCPEYQKPADQVMILLAEDAKMKIKRTNSKAQYLYSDDGLIQKVDGFDWRTGR